MADRTGFAMVTTLRFLDFEHSDDDAGLAVFDALAAVRADQSGALQAEVDMVLAWAEAAFGQAAPIDEGGEWDFDLTRSVDAASGAAANSVRHVVALSITGTPAFAEAFEAAFEAAE